MSDTYYTIKSQHPISAGSHYGMQTNILPPSLFQWAVKLLYFIMMGFVFASCFYCPSLCMITTFIISPLFCCLHPVFLPIQLSLGNKKPMSVSLIYNMAWDNMKEIVQSMLIMWLFLTNQNRSALYCWLDLLFLYLKEPGYRSWALSDAAQLRHIRGTMVVLTTLRSPCINENNGKDHGEWSVEEDDHGNK